MPPDKEGGAQASHLIPNEVRERRARAAMKRSLTMTRAGPEDLAYWVSTAQYKTEKNKTPSSMPTRSASLMQAKCPKMPFAPALEPRLPQSTMTPRNEQRNSLSGYGTTEARRISTPDIVEICAFRGDLEQDDANRGNPFYSIRSTYMKQLDNVKKPLAVAKRLGRAFKNVVSPETTSLLSTGIHIATCPVQCAFRMVKKTVHVASGYLALSLFRREKEDSGSSILSQCGIVAKGPLIAASNLMGALSSATHAGNQETLSSIPSKNNTDFINEPKPALLKSVKDDILASCAEAADNEEEVFFIAPEEYIDDDETDGQVFVLSPEYIDADKEDEEVFFMAPEEYLEGVEYTPLAPESNIPQNCVPKQNIAYGPFWFQYLSQSFPFSLNYCYIELSIEDNSLVSAESGEDLERARRLLENVCKIAKDPVNSVKNVARILRTEVFSPRL